MIGMSSSGAVGVRPALADSDDRRYVWNVNNDRSVRERAIDTESIPWDDHVQWYADVMSDPNRLLYVIQFDDEDCGVVRYDVNRATSEAEITIAVERDFRGRHIGRKVIERTSASILEHEAVDTVVAHVRPENVPSLKAFEAAGYVVTGRDEVQGAEMVRFEFEDPREAGTD